MITKKGNPANHLRMTGEAIFFAAGSTAGVNLGNIVMHKQDANVETKEHFLSQGGRKVLNRTDVIQVKPEYEIELDERFSANLPILVFSSNQTVVTQPEVVAPTGVAAIANLELNATYDIGKRKLNTVLVKKGATTLDGEGENRDYDLNADTGMITFYDGGSNDLADGDVIAITFGCAALSREKVLPFSVPVRPGKIILFETDSLQDGFRIEKHIPCNLVANGSEDTKTDDFTTWKLKCTVTGQIELFNEPRATPGF